MITILHRGGYGQKITILHREGGVYRDPQKWLRNLWMTPYLHAMLMGDGGMGKVVLDISLWEPEKWPEQARNVCSKMFSFFFWFERCVAGIWGKRCKKSSSLLWKRPIQSSPAVGCVEKWTNQSIVAQIQGIWITLHLRWTQKAVHPRRATSEAVTCPSGSSHLGITPTPHWVSRGYF